MTIQIFSKSQKAPAAKQTLEGLIIRLSRFGLGAAYCSVTQAIEWVISDECAAMSHKGRRVSINPEWFRGMANPLRMYWVLHATIHVLQAHSQMFAGALKRFENNPQDALLFGLALDHVVDDMIEEDLPLIVEGLQGLNVQNGLEMPENILRIPQMIGRDAPTVYAFLRDNVPDPKHQPQDEHVADDAPPPPADASGGEDTGQPLDASDVQRLMDAFTVQRNMGRTAAGATPSERSLFSAAVRPLPWHVLMRRLLRTAVTRERQQTTWRRPSYRGAANGLILPGKTKTPTLPELVFVIDTSGSINVQDLSEFGQHMSAACQELQPSRVHLLWVDDEVRRVQEFTPENYDTLQSLMKPAGGGGTDMCVALDWVDENLTKKPVGMVIFTDGWTPFPDKTRGYPIWWLINTERVAPPAAGTTVHFNNH